MAAPLILRFATASDLHWGGYDNWIPERIDLIVNELNNEHSISPFNFLLLNGDVIHSSPEAQAQKEYFKTQLARFNMPRKASCGNHDNFTAEAFQSYWGHPIEHHFEIGDYAFIIMNSGTGIPNYTTLQSWLSLYAQKKYVFIFMHARPDSSWTSVINAIKNAGNTKGGFYAHDHDRYEVIQENGLLAIHGGHNTDLDNSRSWWLKFNSYRITEVYADGRIKTYLKDYTNNIIKNSNELQEGTDKLLGVVENNGIMYPVFRISEGFDSPFHAKVNGAIGYIPVAPTNGQHAGNSRARINGTTYAPERI